MRLVYLGYDWSTKDWRKSQSNYFLVVRPPVKQRVYTGLSSTGMAFADLVRL